MTIYRRSIPSALNDMVFYFQCATLARKTLTLLNPMSVCLGEGGVGGASARVSVSVCVFVSVSGGGGGRLGVGGLKRGGPWRAQFVACRRKMLRH